MFTEKNTQQANAMSYSNYPTFDVNDMALTNNTVLKTAKSMAHNLARGCKNRHNVVLYRIWLVFLLKMEEGNVEKNNNFGFIDISQLKKYVKNKSFLRDRL